MKNFVQPGDHITIPAPAAVVSGGIVEVGQLVGVASTDAEIGEDVSIALQGVYDLVKATGETFATGDPVSVTAGEASTSGSEIGVAIAAAVAGDATVRVLLG